ncbi:MAG TPA: hypothetical protein VGB77_21200 [Abditibacteriaceae bacterium]
MTKKRIVRVVAIMMLGALGYGGGHFLGSAQAANATKISDGSCSIVKSPRDTTTVKDQAATETDCATCRDRFYTPGTIYYMNYQLYAECMSNPPCT